LILLEYSDSIRTMKVYDSATQQGVRSEPVWRWFRDGKIQGRRVGVHRKPEQRQHPTAVYTQVPSAENTSNLESQAERLVACRAGRGFHVNRDIGSQITKSRPTFLALLADPAVGRIVSERTRVGFRCLKADGRESDVVNQAEDRTEDVLTDVTGMIVSFCARCDGRSRKQSQWCGSGRRRMQLLTSHIMQLSDRCDREIDDACFACKNLLQLRENNWASFFVATAAWHNHPEWFLGRPALPAYRIHGRLVTRCAELQSALARRDATRGHVRAFSTCLRRRVGNSTLRM
jgi:putative resolvase